MSKKKESTSRKTEVITLSYKIFSDQRFISAFNVLSNIRDPENFGEYRKVLDLIRKLNYQKDIYVLMLENIQKEYGKLNKITNKYEYPSEEVTLKVIDKIEELKNVEFELDYKPFKLVDAIAKKLTINEILAMDQFFII